MGVRSFPLRELVIVDPLTRLIQTATMLTRLSEVLPEPVIKHTRAGSTGVISAADPCSNPCHIT